MNRPQLQQSMCLILFLCCLCTISDVRQSLMKNVLFTGPKTYSLFAESLTAGIQVALDECQHQFQWETWNCNPLPPTTATFGQYAKTRQVTREMAFLQGIIAAGISHTLSRNCSAGHIASSSCAMGHRCKRRETSVQPAGTRQQQEDEDVSWDFGGCGDRLDFGENVSKIFLDHQETARDLRAAVVLHNYEAGRKAIRKKMLQLCKCHGVSGSCTTRTCWHQVPPFRTVARFLKHRYSRAVSLAYSNGAFALQRRSRFTDLLFIDPSPDYCFTENGTHRTLGRKCAQRPVSSVRGKRRAPGEARGVVSCRRLCEDCGLRGERSVRTMTSKCNCVFLWCCEVKCDTCHDSIETMSCALPEISSSDPMHIANTDAAL